MDRKELPSPPDLHTQNPKPPSPQQSPVLNSRTASSECWDPTDPIIGCSPRQDFAALSTYQDLDPGHELQSPRPNWTSHSPRPAWTAHSPRQESQLRMSPRQNHDSEQAELDEGSIEAVLKRLQVQHETRIECMMLEMGQRVANLTSEVVLEALKSNVYAAVSEVIAQQPLVPANSSTKSPSSKQRVAMFEDDDDDSSEKSDQADPDDILVQDRQESPGSPRSILSPSGGAKRNRKSAKFAQFDAPETAQSEDPAIQDPLAHSASEKAFSREVEELDQLMVQAEESERRSSKRLSWRRDSGGARLSSCELMPVREEPTSEAGDGSMETQPRSPQKKSILRRSSSATRDSQGSNNQTKTRGVTIKYALETAKATQPQDLGQLQAPDFKRKASARKSLVGGRSTRNTFVLGRQRTYEECGQLPGANSLSSVISGSEQKDGSRSSGTGSQDSVGSQQSIKKVRSDIRKTYQPFSLNMAGAGNSSPTTSFKDAIREKKETLKFQGSSSTTSLNNFPKGDGKWATVRVCCWVVVDSKHFDIFVALLIILNAVVIGAQTHWSAQNVGDPLPTAFRSFEIFFTVAFTIEVLTRIVAFGVEGFFMSKDWRWNFFDFTVVLCGLFEEALQIHASLSQQSGTAEDMSNLSILSVLRLIRITRVVRVMQFCRDLRIMLYGIWHSLRSLMWAIMLLLLVMFVIAVCVTQIVTDEIASGNLSEEVEEEVQHYRGLFRSAFSLYKAISGGEDWGILAEPLIDVNPFLGVVFCVYIAFAVFCVLNVVTGVFVENTKRITETDIDHIILEEFTQRRSFLKEVKGLFEELDEQCSSNGLIRCEDFENAISSMRIQAYFRKIGMLIEVHNAHALFELLDSNRDGMFDEEDFMAGCEQLRGGAQKFDMTRLRIENRKVVKGITALAKYCEKLPQNLQKQKINLPQALLPEAIASRHKEMKRDVSDLANFCQSNFKRFQESQERLLREIRQRTISSSPESPAVAGKEGGAEKAETQDETQDSTVQPEAEPADFPPSSEVHDPGLLPSSKVHDTSSVDSSAQESGAVNIVNLRPTANNSSHIARHRSNLPAWARGMGHGSRLPGGVGKKQVNNGSPHGRNNIQHGHNTQSEPADTCAGSIVKFSKTRE